MGYFRACLLAVGMAGGISASASGQVNLSPGDIALIGWCDNCAPIDVYTFVPLVDLPAGTVVYFTDNGWTGTQYRGAKIDDGDGNEQIAKFEVVTEIAAGTIISNGFTDPSYAWTLIGAIPFVDTGEFNSLALSQTGDQVYAFQSPTVNNPLFNASMHLFVLDDTGEFERAINANTGDAAPGLSVESHTAITFNQDTGSTKNYMGFNVASIASGTKLQWLAAIGEPSNWILGDSGSQPEGSIVVIQGECSDGDDDGVCDDLDECPGFSDSIDTDFDGVPDGCDSCAIGDDSLDCDGDGLADACELAQGGDSDVNANGIPDGCECLSDLSGDGQVDGGDLGLLLGAWDTAGPGDLDGDGFVGGSDLGLMLGAWGSCQI
jgi:hypothetical protein